MAVQTVFKRYELKYLMTREQQKLLLKIMDGHIEISIGTRLRDRRKDGI